MNRRGFLRAAAVYVLVPCFPSLRHRTVRVYVEAVPARFYTGTILKDDAAPIKKNGAWAG